MYVCYSYIIDFTKTPKFGVPDPMHGVIDVMYDVLDVKFGVVQRHLWGS